MAIERRELYELVRAQRDDLLRLQLQKEQLVAFLVHDLKNPVNAIDLHASGCSRDPGATERSRDAAARDPVGGARAAAHDRGPARHQQAPTRAGSCRRGSAIPLAELFDEVVDAMRPRAQENRLALSANVNGAVIGAEPGRGGLMVDGDRDLLRRVLENLVDNAIRYAPEGTAIEVTAAACDGGVELRIADAGPGVPPEQRARVFERFVQADVEPARTSRGLGLAFCKLAVEAHGGRIWIEDATPGAIFCVRMPDA